MEPTVTACKLAMQDYIDFTKRTVETGLHRELAFFRLGHRVGREKMATRKEGALTVKGPFSSRRKRSEIFSTTSAFSFCFHLFILTRFKSKIHTFRYVFAYLSHQKTRKRQMPTPLPISKERGCQN